MLDTPSYLLGKKAGGGGTDTSDANATASDIALGKSGYVKGVKVNGNVPIGSPSVSTNYGSSDVSTYLDDLKVDTEQGNTNQFFYSGDKISVLAPLSDVAPVVGATAEKIKKDEVICGVTGTYEEAKYAPKYISFNNYNNYVGANANIQDEIDKIDTSNITNMSTIFGNSIKTRAVNLSGWNTSNVTNMSYMFQNNNNSNFKELDLSMLNTQRLTNVSSMFQSCTFETLDFSSLGMTTVTTTRNMFAFCTNLTHIDLRGLDFTSITDTDYMFGTKASDGPPNNCEIIVADNTQKQWITSKWTRLTNVKTVAEIGE